MIRWLSGGKQKSDDPGVTQDPLEALAQAQNTSYHVKRLNPLYKEASPPPKQDTPSSKGAQDSPRKSVSSSGYESRGNTSSDSSSFDPPPKPKREKRGKQERKKREKPEELIDNVLAANYSSLKRRTKRHGSPLASSHLSPIPEGQVDATIPAPIWPRCAACSVPVPLQNAHNGTTDPKNFIHKYNEHFPSLSNFKIQFLSEVADDHPTHEYQHNWEECLRNQIENARQNRKPASSASSSRSDTLIKTTRTGKPTDEITNAILRDLADFLASAVVKKDLVSTEDILLAVSKSIQRSLSPSNNPTVNGEFLLYSSANREEIYSSSSSSGYKEIYGSSSSSGSERIKNYRRQNEEEVYHGDIEKSSEGESCEKEKKFVHHLRENSSSSLDSSSSFSPASSSSSGKLRTPSLANEEIYGVPIRDKATTIEAASAAGVSKAEIAPMDETKNENCDPYVAECGSKAFEKLISAKRKVSSCKDVACDKAPVLPAALGTKTVVMQKMEHPYYIAMGRPDFTLDVPQAEKMMSKIAHSKRQRCWCRMTASMFALVFFLMSVVVVSLVVTKGRRTFGAL